MKKIWLHNLFVFLKILPLVFFVFSCGKKKQESIATVDNEYISLSSFKTEYQTFLSKIYQEDNLLNRYAYLNNLIDEKLILKYAQENHIEKDSSFLAITKNIYNQLLLNFYFDKNIKKDLVREESELRKFFSWQNTSIHVRHLFARTKKDIQEISDRLYSSEENWETIAMECFQDSSLKFNGGNLGWYNYNDLDPVFAYNAFSLTPGEISEPVRTKDGYSIIHLLEKEHNGLLTENDFQIKKEEMAELSSNFNQNKRILDFTDETVKTLDIQFDKETLLDLYQFLTFVNHEKLEFLQEKHIVSFQDSHLNVSKILDMLSKLSDKQLARISTPFDLEQSIIGIICRERFLLYAQEQKIYEQVGFQEEFRKEKNRSMIKFVLSRLKQNHIIEKIETRETSKEKYFQFRNVLLSNSDVFIDSAMVKNFIM